jgi:hypothetical protein
MCEAAFINHSFENVANTYLRVRLGRMPHVDEKSQRLV